jgi:NTE family protein
MNAPLSPAIHLGADRLLIIGTRDETPIPEPVQLPDYPAAGELGGYLLDTIFMDTTRADLSRLKRINETLSLIPEAARSRSALRSIDALEIKPSRDLSAVTAEHADSIPRSVRTLLKVIGGWGKDWRMPSYLLFEREYTTCLIDLGYQDAMAQADQIIEFLN